MTKVVRGGGPRPPARVVVDALDRARRRVVEDLAAVQVRDPAATSRAEAVLTSPGLHALWVHRIAHQLWQRPGGRLPARVLAQAARAATGVEIHPGAKIGNRVVIDHGMGIVVGETAEIGDDVLMYHGVTLGGTTGGPGKRHPTVGSGVLLGAGAVVLNDIVVGDRASVAANAAVTKSVEPGAVVGGVPAAPINSTFRLSTPRTAHPMTAEDWVI